MAQGGDVFVDGANGAKIHAASGFHCPLQIGYFQRDAVGERNPQAGMDYCAYSALDGVYGTIMLDPLAGPYDPKAALVPEFQEQERTGGRMAGEKTVWLGLGSASVNAYTRSYETSHLGDLHYRVLFAASAIGQWAVQVTVEYASPRDRALEQEFLNSAYAEAIRTFSVAN
ncbi:MAG TPA: hypothetical protein VG819_08880 [Rhizomicrobium sp.]|nr:hypothetical protein [Rhizomicrobium sp.]